MEILHCLFMFWVLNVQFLIQNVTSVDGGRHHNHISKKQMSEIPPELAPDDAPDAPDQSPTIPVDTPFPQPRNISSTSCIFNVSDYGAVGDGDTDDTDAFRAAWKEACIVENGVVLVPSDQAFLVTSTIFSGPCESLKVDGVLMPPDGPDSWPESDSTKQWLVFYNLDGFTFTGSGTIEGNGQKWWDLPCKPHKGPKGQTLPGQCNSPALIRFFMSSNLVVTGLRIQNSPQFHMKFDGCQGVLIEKMSISSPKLSPNTDGIHIENTKSVGIYDSMM